MAGIAEKYGFKYVDQEHDLTEGFKLYTSTLFCPQPYLMKPEAVAVHCCNSSWRIPHNVLGHFITNCKIYCKQFLLFLGLRKEKAIDAIR